MVAITVKYVLAKQLSDGTTAYYWNRLRVYRDCGLRAEALGQDIARALKRANELNAALDAWRTGQNQSKATVPGTVAWLCGQYRATEQFKSKARATQRGYRYSLGYIEEDIGALPFRTMQRRHARCVVRGTEG